MLLELFKLMGLNTDNNYKHGSWKYLNDLYDQPEYSMSAEILAAKTVARLRERDGIASPRRDNEIATALRKVADVLEWKGDPQ